MENDTQKAKVVRRFRSLITEHKTRPHFKRKDICRFESRGKNRLHIGKQNTLSFDMSLKGRTNRRANRRVE
jgi:hypothetical protein